MLEHKIFKIKWVGFPIKQHKKLKGCYLIGNIYVGASNHIRERILSHCREVYSTQRMEIIYKRDKNKCKKKEYILNCILNNKPIVVEYISQNTDDEKDMYIKYNIPIHCNTKFYSQIYTK